MLRLAAIVALSALTGCSDALLQWTADEPQALDDRLALRGRVCTSEPDPSAFPVKVVFLIDKSGSMCVSDGPGSQLGGGLCETVGTRLEQMGITKPGRVRALEELLARFRRQGNVQVALVPFESTISSDYPTVEAGQPLFVPAGDGSLVDRVRALQADLGKGTDYQGALGHAYTRIELDIQRSLASNRRTELPRTKYVVILLTDGSPYPRCSLNDDLLADQYANADRPWAIWRDNPAEFCNANDAGEFVPGFLGGAERNQNHQLFAEVDRLMALRDKHAIGEIRLHTILLFNVQAAELCGQLCVTDLYNGLQPEEARQTATWTLTQLAEVHGEGTFQEFVDAASIELGSLDYTSLASRFAVKTLLARNLAAVPTFEGPVIDSDGEGLADDYDETRLSGTSRFDPDSDRDGFSDAFEAAHRAEEFNPAEPDPRGCRDIGDTQARFSCRDTDGDGLSQAAEAYLETEQTLPDTDADGLPDGVEATLGLDPNAPNPPLLDRDLDGIGDLDEVLFHLNPLTDDRPRHTKDAYRYELVPQPQEDGSICYDFVVSNIRLLPTASSVDGKLGFNLITLNFAEAPEQSVARDYGLWRQACVFAQFVPPSLRSPAGPEVLLEDADFRRLDSITLERGSLRPNGYRDFCKGTLP